MDKKLHDKFIDIYDAIDHYLRKTTQADSDASHSYLLQELASQNQVAARHIEELKAMARLRNSLVHNPFKQYAHPLAQPNRKIVKRYEEIKNALINPPTARAIAVPKSQLYTTTLDANAIKVLQDMRQHVFTHVPVMDGDTMTGVFSENSLLAYLADKGEAVFTSDTTIKAFKPYIGLDKHPSESFEFLPINAPLSDVYRVFNEAIKVRKRVGVLFLTHSGKSTEKVLGIITAWDLASPDLA